MNDIVWQPARILESGDDWVRVGFDQLETCAACLRGEGCGAGVFSRLFGARQATWTISTIEPLAVGERVRVGVSSGQLMLASIVLYGFPLAAFIGAALTAHLLLADAAWRDPAALCAGLLAGAFALLTLRRGRGFALNPRVEPLSCSST
ncbi:MAG: SoxR reducing system RseC family protein [Wenzhouxiangella sp.]|jgi:sigma-E factor negative regulatory protein RseC|nr:SoxR reducing system RseC family protein [Wenzhouxiangella sp.]